MVVYLYYSKYTPSLEEVGVNIEDKDRRISRVKFWEKLIIYILLDDRFNFRFLIQSSSNFRKIVEIEKILKSK